MAEWIPVSERRPEDPSEVEIVYWDGVEMCRIFGSYIERVWWSGPDEIEGFGIYVTHWKYPTPLPKAPEADNG